MNAVLYLNQRIQSVCCAWALVLAFPAVLAAQCSNGTTVHVAFHGLTREASNSVYAVAETYTVGDYWAKWNSYVSSTESLNNSLVHSGTNGPSSYGGTAEVDWHDAPSSVGVGLFTMSNTHQAHSSCGDNTSYGTSDSLSVRRPTITAPNGSSWAAAWYLGGGGDAPNGFYNVAAVTGNMNCGPSDTCTNQPYWSVTAGASKISLLCSVCVNQSVTTQAASDTVGDIGIVISIGGLTSDVFPFTSNAPTTNVYRGCVDQYYGDYGYNSKISYQTTDITGSPMFRIAINETFGPKEDDWFAATGFHNNWSSLPSQGYEYPSSWLSYYPYTWTDSLVANYSSSWTPSTVRPGQIYSDEAVEHYSQDWRIGSPNVGAGIPVQSATVQFYRGHATVSVANGPCY